MANWTGDYNDSNSAQQPWYTQLQQLQGRELEQLRQRVRKVVRERGLFGSNITYSSRPFDLANTKKSNSLLVTSIIILAVDDLDFFKN
jgi:hypothetical protein